MKSPKAGRCHVRRITEGDYAALERMYLSHENVALPEGYFAEFAETIRDPAVDYLVAEVDGRVVGGGGISVCPSGVQAHLTFGIVDPDECGKGYGTAIMLARLLSVNPGLEGCQIVLQATEWSAAFFTRLGFTWYGKEEDEQGHLFLYGTHMVYPGDEGVFQRILREGGVSVAG
ncbi:MAG: GNAT family N-acetyltransferase [Verrucomicrobiaceae bacterium]